MVTNNHSITWSTSRKPQTLNEVIC